MSCPSLASLKPHAWRSMCGCASLMGAGRDDVGEAGRAEGPPCSDVKTNGDSGVCSRCRRRFNYVVEDGDLPCRRLCACRRGADRRGQCDYRPASLRRSDEPPRSSWEGAPQANQADFSLLRLLPRKDRLRRGKGQGHHVLFGVSSLFQVQAALFRFSPRFRTYRCVAPLGDQMG